MSPEGEQFVPDEARESEPKLEISQIDPNDRQSIASYYQFEIDQGFSSVHPETTFEKMVDFRQKQLQEGKLQVVLAKEGDEIVATSVVVLQHGTMGKEIEDNEAYAAGTVVLPNKRGGGIGEKMSVEQDRIATEAEKNFIRTVITNNNYPSMRLRMNVGYQLEGVEKRDDEVNYQYRKDLKKDQGNKIDWVARVQEGGLQECSTVIDESTPDHILINPEDDTKVQQAITKQYKGVFLLRSQDFSENPPFKTNMIVFTRLSQ